MYTADPAARRLPPPTTPMQRLARRFDELRAQGRSALVFFLTAGDPDAESTVALMHALVEAGADVLELGMPFSDPMADGPVIQRASERALAGGMHLAGVIDTVRAFRARDAVTPVVLMGYLNPIEAMGCERFAGAAATAGVDGLLVVDAPPEESADLGAACAANGLARVLLIAPTTSEERIARICASAQGFVYYVSMKGVTGSRDLDVDGLAQAVARVRRHTGLPVGIGFGIRDPQAAAAVARSADAVIVGSALVALIEAGAHDPPALCAQVRDFARGFRAAVDAARRPPPVSPRAP